jgi:hypothetical protein
VVARLVLAAAEDSVIGLCFQKIFTDNLHISTCGTIYTTSTIGFGGVGGVIIEIGVVHTLLRRFASIRAKRAR